MPTKPFFAAATTIATAVAVVLPVMGAAKPAHAGVCLYNESPYPTTLEVRGGSYRDSRGRRKQHVFRGLVPPRSAGCCPRSHAACRHRNPVVSLYWNKDKHRPAYQRVKPRMVKLKLRWLTRLRYIRVPLPMSGQIGPNLLHFCGTTGFRVPRDARIRLHTRKKGRWVSSQCEIFYGRTKLRVIGSRKMPRRTHLFACNDTRQPYIYVVHGYYARRPRGWKTTGYWKVARGKCRQLWLPSAYYRGENFFYAIGGGRSWGGKHAYLCIHPKKSFRQAHADKRCPRGMKKVGFWKRRLVAGSNPIIFRAGR